MTQQIGPTAFVIFGGGGDLAWRKLIPALYNLWLDKWLTEPFQIFCVDGKPDEPAAFLQHLRDGIDAFSRQGKADGRGLAALQRRIQYIHADFNDPPRTPRWRPSSISSTSSGRCRRRASSICRRRRRWCR